MPQLADPSALRYSWPAGKTSPPIIACSHGQVIGKSDLIIQQIDLHSGMGADTLEQENQSIRINIHKSAKGAES